MSLCGLYIHVPFCVHKCNYCGFYSIPIEMEKVKAYLAALKREIEMRSENPPSRGFSFSTVFFGGGTPSLLSPAQVADVLCWVETLFTLDFEAEITLEVNPGAVSPQWFAEVKAAGVNRLSIGIQSFVDAELRLLGRPHTVKEARDTFELARNAGFDNFGIDLLFGIPGQNLASLEHSLESVFQFSPEHISLYGLTLETGTPLAGMVQQGKAPASNPDLERHMYLSVVDLLRKRGYEQYEISNFAAPRRRCKHNELYWRRQPYLGLGPSAHSCVDGTRSWNHREIDNYLSALESDQLPTSAQESLTDDQARLEAIFLSLRTKEGLDLREFRAEFGIDFQKQRAKEITELVHSSDPPLAECYDGHFRLTPHGFLLHDEICRLLA